MSDFSFTVEDRIDTLPEALRSHFPTFLDRRLTETQQLLDQLQRGDLSGIRNYCHRNCGVAASYHLYQFSEIVEELRRRSKRGEIHAQELVELTEEILSYLKQKKSIT